MQRGSRNSRGNAPPIFRAACDELLEPRSASVSGREMRNPTIPLGKMRYRIDSRQLRDLMVSTKAGATLSPKHSEQTHSLPQGIAPAVFGSSKGTRTAPVRDRSPNAARTPPHRTDHR